MVLALAEAILGYLKQSVANPFILQTFRADSQLVISLKGYLLINALTVRYINFRYISRGVHPPPGTLLPRVPPQVHFFLQLLRMPMSGAAGASDLTIFA